MRGSLRGIAESSHCGAEQYSTGLHWTGMRSSPPFYQRMHVLIRATCHRMAAVLYQAAAGCSVVAIFFESVAIVVWQCSYGIAACVSQPNADLRR